jgi:hypothetical protein
VRCRQYRRREVSCEIGVVRDSGKSGAGEPLILRLIRGIVIGALWVSLAAYALYVGRDFYHHVDRAIFVTADDGEAGIAYALANHGRYAFLSTPLLEGMPRLHGQFNYGPWYFYLAAGVIWLFGYSLTAVRAIHFWVVIAAAIAAWGWFRGSNRAAAPALVGFGFLYFFGGIEWPMARPDSLVTAFALAMIVSAGLAVSTERARYWLAAGLAAACGMFTHLIAAALVPAAIVTLTAFVLMIRAEAPAGWRYTAARSTAALAVGVLLGAAMFYGSFGFNVAMQLRFLSGYRDVTASADTYAQAIGKHFRVAFGTLSPGAQALVLLMLAASWVLTIAAAARPRFRRLALAYLLPGAAAWSLYLLSNGKYTNYHSGYAILHHALFLWTAAAVVWVLLTLVEQRPRVAMAAGLLASSLVLVFGVRLVAAQIAHPPRASAGASFVPFSEYEDRVLDVIPARATAWGTALFGIASPDRAQLVQFGDAVAMALRVPAPERGTFAPEYVIWGYPEANGAILETLRSGQVSSTLWSQLERTLPDAQFRLVSLTAGAPYGTTRVYARYSGRVDAGALPLVSAYDAPHGRWLRRVGAPVALPVSTPAPATMRIGYDASGPPAVARHTVVTSLPPGAYLLRVTVAAGKGASNRRLIAITTPDQLTQTISELGPAGEFLPYADGERQTFGLLLHEGGPLYINQFDDGAGAAIEAVEAYPVGDLLDPDEEPSRSHPLPEFTRWTKGSGVRASATPGGLHVDGNATSLDYQVESPMVPFGNGDRVEVRVPSTVTAGRICTGALNAAGRWLVAADAWREVLRFRGDATGGFYVVFANCNREPEAPASRFDIAAGSFVDEGPDLYADHLTMRGLGLDHPRASIADLADLGYRAQNVTREAGTWRISGRAEGKYTFLLRSVPRRLTGDDRVLVTGRIMRGGLTLGLLMNGGWARSFNVDEPGEFRTVLVPQSTATYEIAVANFVGDDLETSIVIDRIEIYPAGSVPQS